MLTEKELNECLKEDIENMEDDNIVNEIAYYLHEHEEIEAESLDNQRVVEDAEYCERYESTYNSDDSSM